MARATDVWLDRDMGCAHATCGGAIVAIRTNLGTDLCRCVIELRGFPCNYSMAITARLCAWRGNMRWSLAFLGKPTGTVVARCARCRRLNLCVIEFDDLTPLTRRLDMTNLTLVGCV